MGFRRTERLRAICLCTAFLSAPAVAQRIDHDALEQAVGEPVTTSVTGKPQRQSDTPASTVIITRDEIARSPARSVPGLLKTYAGIDVNQWTAGQADVAVRGGVQTYNPRLLVLVDGRQVYLDHYGMTDWNLLGVQLEEIQQIELVRGPAGALFGFNAASGVVNIITVDALDRQQAFATVEAGNHGYHRIAGAVATPIAASVGLRLSAGHAREQERVVPPDQLQAFRSNPMTRDEVSATVNLDIDPQTRATVTGGYARNQQMELLVTQIVSQQRYKTYNSGLSLDHDTPWGSLSGNIYSNWLDARYGIGANDPGAAPIAALQTFDLTARTVVAQASGLVRLGHADTGRIGLEYRENRMNSGITFSRRTDYRVLSGSAMLDLQPTERVNVNLAARLDQLSLGQSGAILPVTADVASAFDRSFVTASFNAAAQLRLSDRSMFRLNGGRAVQAPSLTVFGMDIPVEFASVPVPVIVAGDPGITPVTVWSTEFSYTYRPSAAVQFDGGIFYTRTNDAIAYPGDVPELEIRTMPFPLAVARVVNVGDFETYGVELSAAGAIADRWKWRTNYSYTATDENLVTSADLIRYAFLPNEATPRHKVNIVVEYGTDRWLASIVGRYTSATRQIATQPSTDLHLYHVPRTFAVDAKLGYRIRPRMMLSVAGTNLTAASGATISPIPADRRIRAGLTMSL